MKTASGRASAARWRRIPPVGFVRPWEPVLVNRPPAGPGWLHEIKHDGFRIVALKQGDHVQAWSRRGVDFTNRFSRIVKAVRSLPADEAMIDGEAVVFQDCGSSDFYALMTERGGAKASFVAFDLLRPNGDGLRPRPIEARREALMRLVDGDGILFGESAHRRGCGRVRQGVRAPMNQ